MITHSSVRASLLGVALAAGTANAAKADAVVTFNEIHYNPAAGQGGEWIELHNQMAVNIDLSGWSLDDGVSFTFPKGTVIEGGGYLIVAQTPGVGVLAGVPNVIGPFSGSLSNGGETVDLLSSSGRLMDQLSYDDSGEWPVAADGAGATLAKRRPGTTAENPANWTASPQAGGTPSGKNFQDPDEIIVHDLIGSDDVWSYRDEVSAPPAGWQSVGFDDSSWSVGTAAFGTAGGDPVLGITEHLVERFRAGSVTGVADGQVFPIWQDTAEGDGVSQDAVAGSDPRFEVGATATGEPAVSFDSSDEFRTSSTPGIGPTSGFVYFVVCRGSSTQSGGSDIYIFDRDATVDPPLASLKLINGRYELQKRYNDNSGLGGPRSTTSISTSEFQIVAIRRNVSQSRFEIWVDGVMEDTTPDNGKSLTPQPIVIGGHATSSGIGFDGEIAELLVYSDELDGSEFDAVGSYLEAQYGLDTAFPTVAVETALSPSASTSYFRKTFTYAGDPSRSSVELDRTLADGAVFYLNGQEILRDNMPGGSISHASSAESDLSPPLTSGFESVPAGGLVSGTNTLAVSLHTGATDDTAYFSARLRAKETPADPDLASALKFNEIAAGGAENFFVEVANTTGESVSTDGYALEVIGSQSGSFALPATVVPAGGVVYFSDLELGYLPIADDRLVLKAPNGGIADAQGVDLLLRGAAEEWPDRWLYPAAASPGAANVFALQDEIVINELCYKPADVSVASDDKQWIELFNRSGAAIDVGGWSFASGISFEFPIGTQIGAGGYLLVAKSPGSFPTPSGAVVMGPWSGNLAGSGEKVLLVDAVGNPADIVDYVDGGRWPGAADGEGSTLELRDPHSDNGLPESWSASDESGERSWQTYSYRQIAENSTGPDGQWEEFVFGLLDSGEILIDDITVIENPDTTAVEMVANGNFESGTGGWRFLGNHRHAQLVPDPDSPGNTVLHLSANGSTEHMHNHVETTLANGEIVRDGREYEITYRARWLSGSNRLNTRLYFNRAARTTELARTDTPGTPGAVNSTAVGNVGPGYLDFSHSPAVPAPGAPVTVSARVADPDGIGSVDLKYSVNGGGFNLVTMTGEADGMTFTGEVPGQSASDVVQFYVEASDAAGSPATSFFPAGGESSRAMFQVDDGLAATSGIQNIRIIMDPSDEGLLYQTNNLMSNERLGCTVIYGEREIYYDVGVRLKSSQRGRPAPARVGFNIGFNKDQLFRGVHKTIAIDRSEGQITGCQEILYDQMMSASGGVPAEYNDLCQVIAPDPAHTSHGILQLARFGDVFLDSQFDNGGDGSVYEYELIYYPTTTDGNGYKLPQPDNVTGTDIRDLGDDKEDYRWNFLQKNNEDIDDYSRIIVLAKQFGKSGAAFEAGLESVIDVDQWLRALAYSCASGAGDSFFSNSNHNGQFYARPDGRILYFPHDMDFSFSATRNIFENSELQKLISDPSRKRMYLSHLYEICTTVFNQSYMASWAAHFGELLPGENFGGHLNYIDSRSDYILSSINSEIAPVTFEITTNNGVDFSTADSPVTVEGGGWIDVRSIRLAGSELPLEVTWTSETSWEVEIPLAAGPNPIVLEGVDHAGVVVGSDSITITNSGEIRLPTTNTLVVAEIYYNPPGSDELTEYVELMNASTIYTLDLSSVSFTEGITATLPGGTLLPAGGRVLVVKDQTAFEATFGLGLPVVATFPNSLSNGGELLEIRRADGVVIQSFEYDDAAPWPVEADGDGYSLALVDPLSNPDHGDPRSWRASLSPDGGTPGGSDTESYMDWKVAHGNHGDDEDLDGDGFTTRQEYFLGGDPQTSDTGLGPTFEVESGGSFLMSVTRSATAEKAGLNPEISQDLDSWSIDLTAEFLGSNRLLGSPMKDRLIYRITPPVDTQKFFARFTFGQ